MKKLYTILVSAILFCGTIQAQESESTGVELSAGADLVSSYIWRGQNLGSAAFQPGLSVSYYGFTLGAWGSVALISPATDEFDLYLSYSIGGFSATLTDYSFPSAIPDVVEVADPTDPTSTIEVPYDGNGYFDYDLHQIELGVSYTISEKIPLTLSWNTFIAGDDKKIGDDGKEKQNFSSYFEVGYSLPVGSVTLDFAIGGTPWESNVYGTDGFSITNISIKGSKEIKITDSFSLPVFTQAIVNPDAKKAYLVFGLSF